MAGAPKVVCKATTGRIAMIDVAIRNNRPQGNRHDMNGVGRAGGIFF